MDDPILRAAVRDVPDFPKVGVLFKDITPILADGALLRRTIDHFVGAAQAAGAERIAGIDARGFLFGATVADRLGVGFIPVRKKGKLPFQTHSVAYKLEYGEADLEVHVDAFCEGERVVLVDDLLATGGTAAAAIQLVQACGAEVVAALFLIELEFLEGRVAVAPVPVHPILRF
jgi:adenine phosphoribosyltransferase